MRILQIEHDGDKWVPSHDDARHAAQSTRYLEDEAKLEILEQLNRTNLGPFILGTLDCLKAKRFAEVDARTDEIVAGGFTYLDGNRYSLSNEAQSRFLAMLVAKDFLTYPILYNSIDDLRELSLANGDEVLNFVFTAMGAMRSYLDSGTTIKDALRNATTEDEINTIVDPR